VVKTENSGGLSPSPHLDLVAAVPADDLQRDPVEMLASVAGLKLRSGLINRLSASHGLHFYNVVQAPAFSLSFAKLTIYRRQMALAIKNVDEARAGQKPKTRSPRLTTSWCVGTFAIENISPLG
jgi:hypothetical protein